MVNNELEIGGAAKRFRSVAEEWRRKPEPRKARRSRSLSLSKGATVTSKNLKSGFVRATVYLCAGLTLAVLLFMIGYILVKGVSFLRGDLFSWKYTSENCSVVPVLVNTLVITLLALIIDCPLGIEK